jgi:hypothetical protein
MNPPLIKTNVVDLNVRNGCLDDQMTIVTSITDYTYYINENSEINVWNYGTTPKPKDMKWFPQWTQSVPGCPLVQKLYRTPKTPIGSPRAITTSFERTPIYQYDFDPIQKLVLWSV